MDGYSWGKAFEAFYWFLLVMAIVLLGVGFLVGKVLF